MRMRHGSCSFIEFQQKEKMPMSKNMTKLPYGSHTHRRLFFSNVCLLAWIKTGKWVTHEEAFATSDPKQKGPIMVGKSTPSLESTNVSENKDELKLKSGPAPGPVVSAALNPMRSVKGAAPSSLTLSNNKRKRPEEKPKVLSKEEAAAIKAREAAKKRVEEREKPLLGLYGSR